MNKNLRDVIQHALTGHAVTGQRLDTQQMCQADEMILSKQVIFRKVFLKYGFKSSRIVRPTLWRNPREYSAKRRNEAKSNRISPLPHA